MTHRLAIRAHGARREHQRDNGGEHGRAEPCDARAVQPAERNAPDVIDGQAFERSPDLSAQAFDPRPDEQLRHGARSPDDHDAGNLARAPLPSEP